MTGPATPRLRAEEVVARLRLAPHPEGGWYRETWRHDDGPGGRAHGTAIYFLLGAGERSHWHRVDAPEIWHFYAGDPLELRTSVDGLGESLRMLGPDLLAGHEPQLVVPAGAWQSAESTGEWTLVGCTVSPGFVFEAFELAPPCWEPGAGPPP